MKVWLHALCLVFLLVSCGGDDSPQEVIPSPHPKAAKASQSIFENKNKKWYPAVKNNSAFDMQKACSFSMLGEECTPEKVPLMGVKHKSITVQVVLEHTIVSHPFLAKTFKKYLSKNANKYLLSLFSSVSTVVISDEISGSFYLASTSTIYLDAFFFWKTEEEYKQLKKIKSPYAAASSGKINGKTPPVNLDLSDYVVYIKNGFNHLTGRRKETKTRSMSQIDLNISRVLYHELTHAHDYFPRERYHQLNIQETYTENFKKTGSINTLIPDYQSELVYEYSQLYHRDIIPKNLKGQVDPTQFVEDLRHSVLVNTYSFVDVWEALAMWSEMYHMLKAAEADSCYDIAQKIKDGYKTLWVQKNRILLPRFLEQAQMILPKLYSQEMAEELLLKVSSAELEEKFDPSDEEYLELCPGA